MNKLRVLSLFSGIGAFEQALKNIGLEIEIAHYCEIDKYASKAYSLLHNVPESLNLGDITQIDLDKLPKNIDILTHGSPCQSFSIAGKQAGGDKGSNTRSSLMWNSVEIINKIKPKYVIWENVKNVLSVKHKHNFELYLKTLEDMGYTNYYKILNAKFFKVPQNRERIICVSIYHDTDKTFKLPEGENTGVCISDILENIVDKKYYIKKNLVQNLLDDYAGTETMVASCFRSREFQGWKSICPTLCARDYKDPKNIIIPTNIPVNRPNSTGGMAISKIVVNSPSINQVGMLNIKDNERQRRIYATDGISPSLLARSDSPKIIDTTDKPKVQITEMPQQIRVRTYDVNIPKLQSLLKKKKQESGLILKEISEKLGLTKTNVAHWFRTDEYFQVPNPEYWYKLKQMLNITVDDFDKSIMTYETINVNYDNLTNCYYTQNVNGTQNKIAPEKIIVPIIYEEDLTYEIRKLTPRETWRIMGFGDKCFDKVNGKLSNTQLYKQAGNSIVVPLLEAVFKNLFNISN